MGALKDSIEKIGGVPSAASVCGVSQRAIYKWLSADALPRTDYTGETNYAERIAGAPGADFTSKWLLSAASPNKASVASPDPDQLARTQVSVA